MLSRHTVELQQPHPFNNSPCGMTNALLEMPPSGLHRRGHAGGAMIFVISGEIIPETHREGMSKYGTTGLMIGLVVMMTLDVTLG